MKSIIIPGPYLAGYHRQGMILEIADCSGGLQEVIVIGEIKGQVASIPATWWNIFYVWLLDIRYVETD